DVRARRQGADCAGQGLPTGVLEHGDSVYVSGDAGGTEGWACIQRESAAGLYQRAAKELAVVSEVAGSQHSLPWIVFLRRGNGFPREHRRLPLHTAAR